MKRMALLVILGLFLLQGAVFAQGVSHNVIGQIVRSDGMTVPPDGCIQFRASIVGRDYEVLTEADSGCTYSGGVWVVNVGNFPSGWHEGDVMHISFIDTCGHEVGEDIGSLTSAPYDNFGLTTLTAAVGPVLSGGDVSPDTGYASTDFSYSVMYQHPFGAPPDYIAVVILDPDTSFEILMTRTDTTCSYTAGCEYSATYTGLRKHLIHQFHFVSYDTSGNIATGDVGYHIGPVVLNSLPVVTSLYISPAIAYETDVLSADVERTDADSLDTLHFDILTPHYQWYVNGDAVLDAIGPTLTGDYFDKHDTVTVVVYYDDGEEDGLPDTAAAIIIQNSIPTLPEVAILPDVALNNDDLVCDITVESADDDPADVVSYIYNWYQNGDLVEEITGNTVDAAYTATGDWWYCEVFATDGEDTTAGVSTDTLWIESPVLSDGSVDPDTGDARTDFVYSVTYTNPKGLAPEYVRVEINGESHDMSYPGTDEPDYTAGVEFTFVIDSLTRWMDYTYRFSAVDVEGNEATGDVGIHTGPVVENAPPKIDSVTYDIEPDGPPPMEGSLIYAVVHGWDDPDGDPVSYFYSWYVNDTLESRVRGERFSGLYFDKHDAVHVSVTPFDGYSFGSPVEGDELIIENSPPVPPAVHIEPVVPSGNDTLTLVIDEEARDVDPVDTELLYGYQWYRNGEPIEGETTGLLSADWTSRGDTIGCEVSVTDGEDTSFTSDEVVIGNSLPVFTTEPLTYAVDGIAYIYDVDVDDADEDDITFYISGAPDGMEIDQASGVITWEVPVVGEYDILISAFDGIGVAYQRYTLSVLPWDDELLAPRRLEAASGYNSSVPMNWLPPDIFEVAPYIGLGFGGYEVERRHSSEELFSNIAVDVPITSYLDNIVENGETYFYRVRIIYTYGDESYPSDYSNIASATPALGNIYSPYTYFAPAMDGVIGADEWRDATTLNLGGATVYIKNDAGAVYIGVLDLMDSSLDDGDLLMLSFDDDNNDGWFEASPSGEGEYRLQLGADGVSFQGIYGEFPDAIGRDPRHLTPAAFGAIGGGATSPVSYEFALRFTDDEEMLDFLFSGPGGLSGIRLAVYDAGRMSWDVVFPPESNPEDPASFATVEFGVGALPLATVDTDEITVDVPAGEIVHVPVSICNAGDGVLTYHIMESYTTGSLLMDVTRIAVLADQDSAVSLDALAYLGFSYDLFTAVDELISALATAHYDLIIVDNAITDYHLLWDALLDPLTSGTRLLITTFDIDSAAASPLWESLGIEFGSDLGDVRSAISFDMRSSLFHYPFDVPNISRLSGDYYDWGDNLVSSGAEIVGTFDLSPYPVNGAIAIAPEGVAVVNSFITSAADDNDGDGMADYLELLINEIVFLTGGVDIPWLSEHPVAGMIPPGRCNLVSVDFNSDGYDIGTSLDGFVVVHTNDPAHPTFYIRCHMNVVEPEHHTVEMSFPEETNASPGDTIVVPISITNVSGLGINYLSFRISSNPDIAEPIACEIVPDGPFAGFIQDLVWDDGHMDITLSSDRLVADGEGEMLYVTYVIPSTATIGDYTPLHISDDVTYESVIEIDEFTTTDGILTVIGGEVSWRLRLLFYIENVKVDEVTIGTDPDATAMFDDGLDGDDEFIPGAFNAFSDISWFDEEHPALGTDIRSSLDQSVEWYVVTAPEGGVVRWVFEGLDSPELIGSLFLNGTIDMKLVNSYHFLDNDTLVISYDRTGLVPFEIAFIPGWNMFSLPVELPGWTFSELFPDVVDVYWYDPVECTYVRETTPEPGKGYLGLWLDEVSYTLWGSPVRTVDIELHSGWNLIGSVYNNDDFTAPDVVPEDALYDGILYNYAEGAYYPSHTVEPGKGYFLASRSEALLTLGNHPITKVRPFEEISSLLEISVNFGEFSLSLMLAESGEPLLMPPVPPAVPDAYLTDGEGRYIAVPSGYDCELVLTEKAVVSAAGNLAVSLEKDGEIISLDGRVLVPAGSYKLVVGGLPSRFALDDPRPNPFNSATAIRFELPKESELTLEVYNILGERVRTLAEGKYPAGVHSIVWDGNDDSGVPVSSGVYLYRMRAGSFSAVRKVLLMK